MKPKSPRDGSRQKHIIFGISAGALILCVYYIVTWLVTTPSEILRTDYLAFHTGAQLFANGHNPYDYAAQVTTFRGYGSSTLGALPFVAPPVALLPILPSVFFGVDGGYWYWTALQMLCLFAACLIAAWPRLRSRDWLFVVQIIAMGLSAPATVEFLLKGQWDGLIALGVAISLVFMDRDKVWVAAAVIFVAFAGIKPQFAIGIAAFALGWRDRRVLLGSAIGLCIVGLGSLVMVGFGSIQSWVELTKDLLVARAHGEYLGISGLVATWFGAGGLPTLISVFGILVVLSLLFIVGNAVRKKAMSPTLGFALALTASLLAAPHVYLHDFVLLAPVLIYLGVTIPARYLTLVVGWYLVSWSAYLDMRTVIGEKMKVSPFVLALVCVLLWRDRLSARAGAVARR